MNNKDLTTFVFIGGRQDRINQGKDFPKEFYYGYFNFLEKYNNVELFELNKPNRSKVIIIIDKILFKVFKLPFGLANVLSSRSYQQFKKSSNLVLVNEHVFFSTLLLIGLLKIFKKINVTVFLMGMFQSFQAGNIFQKILIKLSFFIVNRFIFLGEGEFNYAKSLYEKNKSKFSFIPFCVDEKFWDIPDEFNTLNREYILFVGNDLNRDYKHLEKIILSLKEYNFKIVSTRISNYIEALPNVDVVKGSWHNKKLSDKELKELYSKAIISIIPLKDTIQPSGQSVALQSMSCKTPVLISETIGFWDKENFIDNKNIFFFKNNSAEDSVLKIRELLSNQDILFNVSSNAFKTVREKYTLKNFSDKLEQIVNFKVI